MGLSAISGLSALCGVFGQGTSSTLNTGIRSFWKLDEATGGQRNDCVGSNHFTDVGTVEKNDSGRVGACADFTALGKHLSHAGIALVDNQPWSFSLWAYIDSFPFGNSADFFGENTPSPGQYSRFLALNNNVAYLIATNSTETNWSLGATLSTGTWHCFVVTCDGSDSDNMKLYFNNDYRGVRTLASSIMLIKLLGRRSTQVDNRLDGRMDCVGIWDKELSSSEASELYNDGSGAEYPF